MTLGGLQESLLGVAAVRARLHDHPAIEGAWMLEVGGAKHEVTFDPVIYEDHAGLKLLSWGTPLLDQLLKELEAN
jgi:hypothetical protein